MVIDLEEARDLLRQNGWLSHTPANFRDAVYQRSHLKKLKAGETLFLAGDEPRGLYGLATGRLGAFIAPDETLPAFAYIFHPGSWFGEIPALTGRHHVVGLKTTSEATLLHLPAHALTEMLTANPEYWRFLGQLAAEHVEISIGVVADLMRRDSKQRLVALILRLAGCRAPGQSLFVHEIDASQEDLAAFSNLARTTVIGILNQLEEARLVERHYRRLRIANPDALRALIQD
jgi:CRP/FNR family transcriptional regulator, cyclic AMP receptor protein